MGPHRIILLCCLLASSLALHAACCRADQDLVLVETVQVDSSGDSAFTVSPLRVGANYVIEASGTWFWHVYNGLIADARWLTRDDWQSWFDSYLIGSAYWDPCVVGLFADNFNDTVWGDYNPTHVYRFQLAGTGSALRLGVFDEFVGYSWPCYGDNSGGLTVRVYEVVPEPGSDVSAAALYSALLMTLRHAGVRRTGRRPTLPTS